MTTSFKNKITRKSEWTKKNNIDLVTFFAFVTGLSFHLTNELFKIECIKYFQISSSFNLKKPKKKKQPQKDNMYIKRIAIQGFKTYKNTTLVDNISPHHNVVIGSNGSGKSNFFAAIRFVLSDDYNNLRREERVALIHQGTGSVMSAYVEIVFDNSDKRMHVSSASSFSLNSQYEQDEVVIRRTIGLKKDEYSVNGKSKTKQEIKSLLESAGFSTSNPYYIVPQGRITALTNAKDHERLNLLKDVTGANLFEKKLKDSLANMEETENKRLKISSELAELNFKLGDLNEEKEQLIQCQDLEKQKKVLEYTLYDRELSDVILEIDKFQANHQENVNESTEYVEELEKRETLVREIMEKIQNLNKDLALKESTKVLQLKEQKLESDTEIAKLEIAKNDVQQQLSTERLTTTKQLKLLKHIESRIKSNILQINETEPAYRNLSKKESAIKTEIEFLSQRQRYLINKKGKYAKFSTQSDRDVWIKTHVSELNDSLEALKKDENKNTQEVAALKERLSGIQEQLDDIQDSIDGPDISGKLSDAENSLLALKSQYYEQIDQRKQHWRQEQTLKTVLDSVSTEIEVAERKLTESMNRNLSNGLNAVKKIAKNLNLGDDKIFGTLGELIQFNEKYKTCVEVIGGNALFHVVVDNENTATILMNELHKDKLGRVTFMPLNKLDLSEQISYPSMEENCIPLIKKLHFDPKFSTAVKLIFGRTIVVKELTTGVRLAKQYKLTSITPDGDRVDQKGVLSGGFNDFNQKTTRLDSLKILKQKRNEFAVTERHLAELKAILEQNDTEIDKINSKIKEVTSEKESLSDTIESFKNKKNQLLSSKYGLEEQNKLLSTKLSNLKNSIETFTSKIATLKADLHQPFNTELSNEENLELDSIKKELQDKDSELSLVDEQVNGLSLELEALKSENKSKLEPQMASLKQTSAISANISDLETELVKLEAQLSKVKATGDEITKSLADLKNEINNMTAERANNEKLLEKANSQQRLLLKKIDEFQKDSEKAMMKKATLTARKDELQRRISELGFLPEDAFSKFEAVSTEKCVQQLTKVTKRLSKFTNVNKRAGESFTRFLEKKEDLENKAKDLDLSKKSIEDLIKTLKDQKVHAIETTFEKVSLYFTEMFEKLVPRGTGKLIIHRREEASDVTQNTRSLKKRKRAGNSDTGEELGDPEEDASQADNLYEGVSISVSFNSKHDEQLHVEQLSGGQKTVCAIALILAIQKVDPAPFYLFDEVDAALDKQFRNSVAATIKELSVNAQFICTTFRTDMLQRADRFYKVKFENKLSTVVEVSRDEAIHFIKGDSKNTMAEV